MTARTYLAIDGEADTVVTFASQQRPMNQIKKINGCEPEGKSGKNSRTR